MFADVADKIVILSLLFFMPLAHAGHCFRTNANVGFQIRGVKKAATIYVLRSGQEDLMDGIALIGSDLHLTSNLNCLENSPVTCTLEDDGGAFTLSPDGDGLRLQTQGSFVVSKDDSGEKYLMVKGSPLGRALFLKLVSESECKPVFPNSREILITPVDEDTD